MNSRAWVEQVYVGLAVVALVGTWTQAFGYLGEGPVEGNVEFWKDAVANPAATFLVVDLFVLGGVLLVLMFAEARRVGIAVGWVWGYLVLSILVAASVAIPLFLAHRERRLRLSESDVQPRGTDLLGVGLGIAVSVAVLGFSLANLP